MVADRRALFQEVTSALRKTRGAIGWLCAMRLFPTLGENVEDPYANIAVETRHEQGGLGERGWPIARSSTRQVLSNGSEPLTGTEELTTP